MADSPCTQGHDIQWGYYPKTTSSCPSPSCGIAALRDFSTEHPEWVGIIENEAINSFKNAYSKYPIQVSLAIGPVPTQDYVAYVLGDGNFPGGGLLYNDKASSVFYFALMEGAQEALGKLGVPNTSDSWWISYSPSYPPEDTAKFVEMLRAMGRAIGNVAAHEIGHHLERVKNMPSNDSLGLPYMDCGLGYRGPNRITPIQCEDNINFVYGFFSAEGYPQETDNPQSSGAMFFYGVPGGQAGVPVQPPIHWGPSDVCWLRNYAAPESCVKPK